MTEQRLIARLIEHGEALMKALETDAEAKASDKVQLLAAMTRLAALDARENKHGSGTGIAQYHGIIAATTGAANGGGGGSGSARAKSKRGSDSVSGGASGGGAFRVSGAAGSS